MHHVIMILKEWIQKVPKLNENDLGWDSLDHRPVYEKSEICYNPSYMSITWVAIEFILYYLIICYYI